MIKDRLCVEHTGGFYYFVKNHGSVNLTQSIDCEVVKIQ